MIEPMNLNLQPNRFAEGGVRPQAELDGSAVRNWRLGALVFRPDFARMSHEVGRSAERRRIVVWAIRATGSARCRKNVCGNRPGGKSRGNSNDGFFALEGIPAGVGQPGGVEPPDLPSIPLQAALRLRPRRAVSSAGARTICSCPEALARDP